MKIIATLLCLSTLLVANVSYAEWWEVSNNVHYSCE